MIKIFKKIKYSKKGSVLLMAVLVLAGILSVSLVTSNIVINGLKMSNVQSESIKAYFAAEAGIERSLWEVRKGGTFSYPSGNTAGIFSGLLINESEYRVDYLFIDPNAHFISIGKYKNTSRSIEVFFQVSG